jgi:predicted nucleic acid-binding protein
MNGGRLFLDTNIILYFLNGDESLLELLSANRLFTSFITEMELLGMSGITLSEESQIVRFLENLEVVGFSDAIKKHAISLRRKYRMKLPDSIIAATAIHYQIPLLTADKGFMKAVAELQLIYYEL